MRRIALILTGTLVLNCSVQAASFDCAKSQTTVEKMICADAELSELDVDLNAAYSNILKHDGSATSIRTGQKQWVKERNACRDAACLKNSYNQRIAFLKSPALAPFTFTQNETLPKQSDTPVCKDFQNYLNHPRSNELFKSDGALVRESDLFKSVIWEMLDKEQYRIGFTANLEATRPKLNTDGSFVSELLQRYASTGWALQRTLAYPFEYVPKPNQPQRWIFRLVKLQPYTRDMTDLKSKVELPTWFHFGEYAVLGNMDGSPFAGNWHSLNGTSGSKEWITYAGHTYAVGNATYGNGKGAIPSYLGVEINELNVDPSGQSFMHFTCSFRAKNSQ